MRTACVLGRPPRWRHEQPGENRADRRKYPHSASMISSRTTSTAGAKPTFLIIGAFKCGTTSLHHYLSQHPDIQMPALKEADFFSGPPDGAPYPTGAKRIKHPAEYERLFDPTVAARGEASPNYTVYPARTGTPARIFATIPHVKLIYLVRDPVIRTLLHYHHHLSTMGERRSLADALGDPIDPDSLYVCASLYATQLELYLRYFAMNQMLIVDQADLYSDRLRTLRRIFAFLSVDETFESAQFEVELGTRSERRTYSRFNIVVRLASRTPLQRLPQGMRVAMRRGVDRLVSKPLAVPDLSADMRSGLETLFAGEAKRLREMTGQSFAGWSV